MSTREEFEKVPDEREAFEAWVMQSTLYSLETSRSGRYIHNSTAMAWETWQARQPEIDALRARVAELEKDAARLDWLGDVTNDIAVVSLPIECVLQDMTLRGAIDAAMEMEPKPCT